MLAEEKYRILRAKLVMFLQQNRCMDAENAADETIKRAVAKIGEGAEMREGVPAYCFGIARNVMRETRRERVGEELNEAAMLPKGRSDGSLLPPEQQVLVDQYMDELPREDRELFRKYHTEDREQLAASLGLNANSLRIRVCRIRESIEPRLNAKKSRKYLETISVKAAC